LGWSADVLTVFNIAATQSPSEASDCRYHSGEIMAKAATAKAGKSNALSRPVQPSAELAQVVGSEPLPRSEVTKRIWAYIKEHNLQNPENKREIIADSKLQPIFGTDKLDMFQMTKAVNKHLK
jgi:chromatin remodeling complex protein RSC6